MFANYERVGLCTTRREDKSESSTALRMKRLIIITPERETASPDTVINGGDSSDEIITCASETSELSAGNRGQGRGQGGRTRRVGHQGRGGQGG